MLSPIYYKESIRAGCKIEHNNEVYEIKGVINKGGFSFIYDADMVIYGGQTNIVRRELFRQNIILKELYIEGHSKREDGFKLIWHDENNEDSLSSKIKFKTISEAQKLQNLSSPHIIEILSAFEQNNTVYLATKKINNAQDLGSIININDDNNSNFLNLEKALKYIYQVSNALKIVHDKNILHLDIKPDNILIDDQDNAVLIDFGISISIDDQRKTTLLGARTPHYSPPEQGSKISFNSISYATDIYALGCTLYVLLTGKLVPDYTEIVAGTEVILAPSYYNKEVSPYLDEVIFKAISLKKENRFPNLDEFIYALKSEEDYYTLLEEAKELLNKKEFSKAAEKLNSTTRIIPFTKEAEELNQQIAISFEEHKAQEELIKIKKEAEELIHLGHFESALQLYNKIPENQEIATLKAQLKHEIKKQNIEVLKQKAEEYEQKKQFKEALETYIQLKKLLNTEIEVDQKINFLQEFLLKDEQYTYFITKGDGYFKDKQYELAIIEYNKAKNLNINPTYPDAQIKMCEKEIISAEEKEKELKKERRYIQYQKAIEKGDKLVEKGKYEAAIIEYNFSKTLTDNPQEANDKIHFCNEEIKAARRKEELNEKKKQEEEYQKKIEKGDALFIQGLYEEALVIYQHAKQFHTDNYEVEQKIKLCERKIIALKEIQKEATKEKNYLIEKIKNCNFEDFESIQNEVLNFLEKHEENELRLILQDARFLHQYQKAENALKQKKHLEAYKTLQDLENQPINETLRNKIISLKELISKEIKSTSEFPNNETLILKEKNENPSINQDSSKLVEAPIPPTHQTMDEEEQSKKIALARSLFFEKKIKNAIHILQSIPKESKLYKEAFLLLQQYEKADNQIVEKTATKKNKKRMVIIATVLGMISVVVGIIFISSSSKIKAENPLETSYVLPKDNNEKEIDVNSREISSKNDSKTPTKVNNGQPNATIAQNTENQTDVNSSPTSKNIQKEEHIPNSENQHFNETKKPKQEEIENIAASDKTKGKASTNGDLIIHGHNYKGGILNGKANGNGTLTFQKSDIVSKDDPNATRAEKGDYLKGRWKEGRLEFGTLFSDKGEKKATIIIGRY